MAILNSARITIWIGRSILIAMHCILEFEKTIRRFVVTEKTPTRDFS